MREEYARVESDVSINEDTVVFGVIVGQVTVCAGHYLELQGTVRGGICVKCDARLDLYGTVTGNVINDGGTVRLFGIVEGDAINRSGTLSTELQATVKGSIETHQE